MFLRFPFNSDRKRITTGIKHKGKNVIFLTGGSEIVVDACKDMYSCVHGNEKVPLDRAKVEEELASLTKRGLRVVAIGVKETSKEITDE